MPGYPNIMLSNFGKSVY
jgi:hypothetical protein